MYVYLQTVNDDVPQKILLKTDACIGRSHECNLRIPSRAVSRKHCLLKIHDGAVSITDLGSSNGTRVNRKKITPNEPYALKHGDLLKIGGIKFHLIIKQPAAVAISPPATGPEVLEGIDLDPSQRDSDIFEELIAASSPANELLETADPEVSDAQPVAALAQTLVDDPERVAFHEDDEADLLPGIDEPVESDVSPSVLSQTEAFDLELGDETLAGSDEESTDEPAVLADDAVDAVEEDSSGLDAADDEDDPKLAETVIGFQLPDANENEFAAAMNAVADSAEDDSAATADEAEIAFDLEHPEDVVAADQTDGSDHADDSALADTVVPGTGGIFDQPMESVDEEDAGSFERDTVPDMEIQTSPDDTGVFEGAIVEAEQAAAKRAPEEDPTEFPIESDTIADQPVFSAGATETQEFSLDDDADGGFEFDEPQSETLAAEVAAETVESIEQPAEDPALEIVAEADDVFVEDEDDDLEVDIDVSADDGDAFVFEDDDEPTASVFDVTEEMPVVDPAAATDAVLPATEIEIPVVADDDGPAISFEFEDQIPAVASDEDAALAFLDGDEPAAVSPVLDAALTSDDAPADEDDAFAFLSDDEDESDGPEPDLSSAPETAGPEAPRNNVVSTVSGSVADIVAPVLGNSSETANRAVRTPDGETELRPETDVQLATDDELVIDFEDDDSIVSGAEALEQFAEEISESLDNPADGFEELRFDIDDDDELPLELSDPDEADADSVLEPPVNSADSDSETKKPGFLGGMFGKKKDE